MFGTPKEPPDGLAPEAALKNIKDGIRLQMYADDKQNDAERFFAEPGGDKNKPAAKPKIQAKRLPAEKAAGGAPASLKAEAFFKRDFSKRACAKNFCK